MTGRQRALGVATFALAIVAGACSPLPTRMGTIAGEPWRFLQGNGDGMRGLEDFAGADGMLWDHGGEIDPTSTGWVMDGVRFPLDIAWFDGSGTLVGTTTMPLCPDEPCPLHHAPAPYRWAVEAPVGAFDDIPSDARIEVDP